jgi:hypothetical protein
VLDAAEAASAHTPRSLEESCGGELDRLHVCAD